MTSTDELVRTKLVRRFTADLEPASDLAVQTKKYQDDLDAENDAREKLRMDSAYNSQAGQSPVSAFRGVELARQTLQAKCDEFFASLAQKEAAEKKKSSVLRLLHRSSVGTEQKLAKQIRESGEFTASQVNSITKQLEKRWNDSNSKVAMNFMKICQKLDSHKQIFQWFPNQTTYTSILCGAVTMVVQASVNYSSIAEKLSGYVAELSDSISVCTKWLNLYDRLSMKTRLSDIYTQFFDFFIEVATWYLKPKPQRWLDSFNSDFSAGYNSAAQVIKNSIELIKEEAQIENALEVKAIVPHMDESLGALEDRIIAQVIQSRRENNEVGRGMYNLFLETAREMDRLKQKIEEIHASQHDPSKPREVIEFEDNGDITQATELPDGLSRAEAENLCSHLQSLIDQVGGSDGIRLAIQTGRLLVEPTMIHALGKWTQATSGNARILWISSPYEAGAQTSAQLVALGVIWTAIHAKAQFISYISQRPHYGKVPEFQGAEDKAGVLAMVYSLIRQLLQFQPPDDNVYISAETVDKLTDPADNWNTAMNLLKILLDNTPTLRYCIISGLNLLEGGGRDMCQEFVDVLLDHVNSADWPVRVLFTTSGQSRVLFRGVAKESKATTSKTFHQMRGLTPARDIKMLE
ncbi:hypothetical protein BDW59DRAFT_147532 [Aspergillus cavernicola]|uniref:DUF7708 domain-containing protein n=1 Tax=Aspergillus cavernicola TaxID=176166 RepID=A0ABR4I9B6_9EURO